MIIESVIEPDAIEREVNAAIGAFDEKPGSWRVGTRSLVAV